MRFNIAKHVLAFAQDASGFCFPAVCRVCDKRAIRWPLCGDCFAQLESLEAQPFCHKCALPLSEPNAPCAHCVGQGLYPFERVLRLCNYAEPIQQLVVAMKFHHAWNLGEFLADRLFAQAAVRRMLNNIDVVVPVPLHPLRQVERGYNQAEVIARRLAKRAHLKVATVAIRITNTNAQTETRSRTQRLANLKNAFGVLSEKTLAGKRVLVVDDVRTTAATIQSVGRSLKTANPAGLSALVVAAADAHHANFETI